MKDVRDSDKERWNQLMLFNNEKNAHIEKNMIIYSINISYS